MLRRILLLACPFALASIVALPAVADDDDIHIPTLTVSGTAVVAAAPDQAQVRLAVVSEGEDATDVARDNAKQTTAVMRALTNAGAKADDIETSGYSVEPIYDYNRQRDGKPPVIIGYRVSNEVQVTTLNLDKTGELIGAGIEAGANRINGLQFTLRDNTAQRARAIAEATAAARADARALAGAAGVELGPIDRIDLVPQYVQPVMREFAGRAAVAMDAAPPISPGDIEVRAQVNIVYRIGQAD
ncbi:MAG: SIMPL domain-containing protein [Phycisphaeraceae bacterium]|nr:SIMPL domain-containing protein [Phycisphaeraceae bacterium]